MSLYLGNTPIAVNSSSRNIGEIVQSTIPLTDAGLHLLDGSLISGSGAYADFVTHIAGLVSTYPEIFETEANWQSAVAAYGVCGKFVYDSVNNTVRLPKYSDKIYTSMPSTVPVKGNGNALGLTLDGVTDYEANFGQYSGVGIITILNRNSTYTSASTLPATKSNSGAYADLQNRSWGLSKNASLSGAIADLANITTALEGYYYIVIATSTKTNIEVDIDEVMTDLNGKADVDLSNVNSFGTALASGWSMPSSTYDSLTLGASGAWYTAPANGWYAIAKAGNNGEWVYIGDTTSQAAVFVVGTSAGYAQGLYPVKKGKQVQISYTANGGVAFFNFIYAEGEQ